MPNFALRHESSFRSPAEAYPALERGLRHAVWIGLALVVSLPAARSQSDWLGWMPLWLIGMPSVAWWALHRFRLPHGLASRASAAGHRLRRRRFRGQARRCVRPDWRQRSQAA